jgi:hypothetical protein
MSDEGTEETLIERRQLAMPKVLCLVEAIYWHIFLFESTLQSDAVDCVIPATSMPSRAL